MEIFKKPFIFKNDVRDCHKAVLKILETKSEIDQSRIALIGHSYGGFIAAHLSIQYPSLYKAIALSNPIVNLASMASTSNMPDWVWQMLGKNYTHSSVSTEIYLDAWNRYLLYLLIKIEKVLNIFSSINH